MPKKGAIPTRDEIKQLPRWAQVAFATRCARRVQPLFTAFWPDTPQKYVEVLEQAIVIAEKHGAATIEALYGAIPLTVAIRSTGVIYDDFDCLLNLAVNQIDEICKR